MAVAGHWFLVYKLKRAGAGRRGRRGDGSTVPRRRCQAYQSLNFCNLDLRSYFAQYAAKEISSRYILSGRPLLGLPWRIKLVNAFVCKLSSPDLHYRANILSLKVKTPEIIIADIYRYIWQQDLAITVRPMSYTEKCDNYWAWLSRMKPCVRMNIKCPEGSAQATPGPGATWVYLIGPNVGWWQQDIGWNQR